MSASMLFGDVEQCSVDLFLFLHEHTGDAVGAKEDRRKNVPRGHAYYGDVCLERRPSEGSVGDAEAPNFVQAKVDLRNCEALHFVTCHCCRDS